MVDFLQNNIPYCDSPPNYIYVIIICLCVLLLRAPLEKHWYIYKSYIYTCKTLVFYDAHLHVSVCGSLIFQWTIWIQGAIVHVCIYESMCVCKSMFWLFIFAVYWLHLLRVATVRYGRASALRGAWWLSTSSKASCSVTSCLQLEWLGQGRDLSSTQWSTGRSVPDSNFHGANMGPTWSRQGPCGPHVAPWTLLSGVANTGLKDSY